MGALAGAAMVWDGAAAVGAAAGAAAGAGATGVGASGATAGLGLRTSKQGDYARPLGW